MRATAATAPSKREKEVGKPFFSWASADTRFVLHHGSGSVACEVGGSKFQGGGRKLLRKPPIRTGRVFLSGKRTCTTGTTAKSLAGSTTRKKKKNEFIKGEQKMADGPKNQKTRKGYPQPSCEKKGKLEGKNRQKGKRQTRTPATPWKDNGQRRREYIVGRDENAKGGMTMPPLLDRTGKYPLSRAKEDTS